MKRRIMILGAGTMQLPAIRAARRLGLEVIVADAVESAPGVELADRFVHVDLKDVSGLIAAAREIAAKGGLDAVFTAGTDFSASVSAVAADLGLSATSPAAAHLATDKVRMRERLAEAGINVPRFAELDQAAIASSDRARLDAIGYPAVVKPVDSMGARGVVRVENAAEAYARAAEAVEFSRSGRVIIEEFIGGDEFSVDALVWEADVQITGVADRHICYPPYFIEVGHTLPTALPEAERVKLEQTFVEAIRVLGIGPGAAKGDIKLWNGRVYVGEIAARLSGGYMSGWTYPFATGVPLTEYGIRIALGEPAPRVRVRYSRTSAERALLSIPGLIQEYLGISRAQAVSGVETIFVTRSRGDRVTFPRNNVEKAANVIAVRDSRSAATEAAQAAISRLIVRLCPDEDETDRFLLAPANEAVAGGRNAAYHAYSWADEIASVQAWSGALKKLRIADSVLRVWIPGDHRTVDWSYRTARESVSLVSSIANTRIDMIEDRSKLTDQDRLVSRCLARGGAQGLLYAVDVMRAG